MDRCIRVLIVDDSQDDATLIADELAGNGYDCDCVRVETQAQMRDALDECSWDVVIADYTLPNFSGPEALQLLKETGHDIPLILVSGTAPDQTGIDMMRAGAKDFVLKHNLSRLAAAVEREIKEAEGRLQRRQAEQALREAELHKLEFYRRTILAATDGKLMICEKEEIENIAGVALTSWVITDKESLSAMRDDVRRIATSHGMDEDRIPYLLSCVVEASANSVKHAGSGHASLHIVEGGLLFMVSDNGPGIVALALPDVALTKGYSTSGTLGMGYKMMLDAAERVYLATGPNGTTVAAEVAIENSKPESATLLQKFSGW